MQITVSARIAAPKKQVWDFYTLPEHITQWNFADPSWHCPSASNDLRVGGTYVARMEARDGSFGFDFAVEYTAIEPEVYFSYVFGDRTATVQFNSDGAGTEVIVTFDPETENPIDLQKNGWQAILNNFKKYVEEK